MMDWTDRHCRYLHRLISREALLYTEMVTAPALVRGQALHLLDYNPEEHPVALQLGGSDPAELAAAARLGPEPRRRGQLGRIGATTLQGDRVFFWVVVQQVQRLPPHQRRRGHHLGVKQRLTADEPVQIPAMTVGPIHHRRDGQARGLGDCVQGQWAISSAPAAFGTIPRSTS